MGRRAEELSTYTVLVALDPMLVQPYEGLLCHVVGQIRVTRQAVTVPEQAGVQLVECGFEVHSDKYPKK